jgi:hypothetical protein
VSVFASLSYTSNLYPSLSASSGGAQIAIIIMSMRSCERLSRRGSVMVIKCCCMVNYVAMFVFVLILGYYQA